MTIMTEYIRFKGELHKYDNEKDVNLYAPMEQIMPLKWISKLQFEEKTNEYWVIVSVTPPPSNESASWYRINKETYERISNVLLKENANIEIDNIIDEEITRDNPYDDLEV